jgi:hypothetical protein
MLLISGIILGVNGCNLLWLPEEYEGAKIHFLGKNLQKVRTWQVNRERNCGVKLEV